MIVETNPTRRIYDRLADIYDRRWKGYIDATLTVVTDGLEFAGDEQILDIACGTGELERRLLDRWPRLRITGVDLSGEMLQQAASKDFEAAWSQVDVRHLPFPDQSFDHVLCASSFHYFRGAEESLKEVQRVLRPGGKFVLVDWCDDYLSCKLCSIWLRWTDPAFYRTYSAKTCGAMLEHAGHEIVQFEQFRVMWLWGLMRFESQLLP